MSGVTDTRSKSQLLAMSFSKVSCFKDCEYKAWLLYIAKKVTFTDNQYSIEGSAVHKELEEYLRDGKPLTRTQYQLSADKIKKLIAEERFYEKNLAINDRLVPCTYFDKLTWLRATIDVLFLKGDHALVLDHKSGKKKKGLELQLRISALLVFYNYPKIQKITASIAWLKTNEFENWIIGRDEIPIILSELKGIYDEMEICHDSGGWKPEPAMWKCRYCSCREMCTYKL